MCKWLTVFESLDWSTFFWQQFDISQLKVTFTIGQLNYKCTCLKDNHMWMLNVMLWYGVYIYLCCWGLNVAAESPWLIRNVFVISFWWCEFYMWTPARMNWPLRFIYYQAKSPYWAAGADLWPSGHFLCHSCSPYKSFTALIQTDPNNTIITMTAVIQISVMSLATCSL